MMIPPLVRIGPIPRPHLNRCVHEYLILTAAEGWVMTSWWHGQPDNLQARGNIQLNIQLNDPRILCWMPQDGS